ncbi:MAG: radical SAM protein [Deltaproteobacteria bacterium]
MSGDIIALYRARLAAEKGTVIKDWGGRLSIALTYPNAYRLGMTNLGFQIVYGLLNQRSDVVAERVFLPEGEEMSLYLHSGKPLCSLETQRPLHQFDLVAFSLSFENDYPNVLRILDMGDIGPFREERPATWPLVMGGGIATFLNPEPLAPFMDVFLLGEAEENLNALVDILSEARFDGPEKGEVFSALLKRVKGVYIPSLYRPRYGRDGTLDTFSPTNPGVPERVKVPHVPKEVFCEKEVAVSTVLTPQTEFGERTLIELGRGCGRSCRFCAAGYVYRPPRVYEQRHLAACIEKAMSTSPQLGLLSAAVSDTPGIEDLTGTIVANEKRFSVSSLRADTLTRGLMSNLKASGQKSVAIAPEAGSERLRRVINKHLTRDQILSAVQTIAECGRFSLRLYLLIGLPTETGTDIAEIVDLVKKIKHHMVKFSATRGTIGKIILSLNCFVPKPFTPFQWCPLEDIGSLKAKQKHLRRSLLKVGGIKINTDLPKWAYIQALLSTGDRRVGRMLYNAHKAGGDWKKALRFSEVNPDFFVYRPKGLEERLPWDFMDHGISKAYLIKERAAALRAEESAPCDVGNCFRCGVCRPNDVTSGGHQGAA